jgi:hypothetical protein
MLHHEIKPFFLIGSYNLGFGCRNEEINCKMEDCCWSSHHEDCQPPWRHRGTSATASSNPQGYSEVTLLSATKNSYPTHALI